MSDQNTGLEVFLNVKLLLSRDFYFVANHRVLLLMLTLLHELSRAHKILSNVFLDYIYTTQRVYFYWYLLLFVASAVSGVLYWYQIETYGNNVLDTSFILISMWALR